MEAIAPQVVFYLFGLPITDTVVSTWVLTVILIVLAAIIGKAAPGAGEMIVEMISGIISSVMPNEEKAVDFLPFLGTLVIFLLLGNIFSIFPLMVSPTANINTTLAMALLVFFAVHYYGIREKGLWSYIKDTATPIFVFPLEIVSQLSRTLSLTIRLFGNILSTDMIVAIVFSLIPFLVPLPLAALGMLTGVLQAYIFTVLASLYIASAIEIAEVEEERRELKQELKQEQNQEFIQTT
jgi:F-type H+-transporting ATPase subunit a